MISKRTSGRWEEKLYGGELWLAEMRDCQEWVLEMCSRNKLTVCNAFVKGNNVPKIIRMRTTLVESQLMGFKCDRHVLKWRCTMWICSRLWDNVQSDHNPKIGKIRISIGGKNTSSSGWWTGVYQRHTDLCLAYSWMKLSMQMHLTMEEVISWVWFENFLLGPVRLWSAGAG